jgi:dTDP-glucose pyrophosphorylase
MWSIDCLPMDLVNDAVLVVRDEDYGPIADHFSKHYEDVPFEIVVDPDPKGQAASTLVGLDVVPLENDVIIANCDQWVRPVKSWRLLHQILNADLDFVVPVFENDGNSKWSFVDADEDGMITSLVEKPEQVDPAWLAVVGIFAANCEHIQMAIRDIMEMGKTVNGEYYTATAVDQLVLKLFEGRILPCYMKGIGTPEDARAFSVLPE